MLKKEFQDYVCRPYCIFFKEGEKEEMYCNGGNVVSLLNERGKLIREYTGPLSRNQFNRENNNEILRHLVCDKCSFIEDGCDFQSVNSSPDDVPCGGYILLSLLLDTGHINTGDIEEVFPD